jgi:hypothetical protein
VSEPLKRIKVGLLRLDTFESSIMERPMKKNLAIATLLVIVSAATIFGQDTVNSSPVTGEEAVRLAVYESTFAALTADVENYHKHAAQHMLDLYKLMYQELIKDREMRNAFQQNGIKGWKDFMTSRVRHAASRFDRLSRMQIAELARREAAGSVTFISDKEAKSRGVRILFEDKEWKVDASEAIKTGLLRDPNNHLAPESRARIERF